MELLEELELDLELELELEDELEELPPFPEPGLTLHPAKKARKIAVTIIKTAQKAFIPVFIKKASQYTCYH
jgi:GMP synthase PP-ATPase subunit